MRSLIKKESPRIVRINEADWPIKKSIDNYEPNFIFLLTSPNSGSTVISQVFNNSPLVSQLQQRGEGQWLIKGLCSNDRWNAEKVVDKRSIRSVWISECYNRYKTNGSLYFIEKSPPNMMRIEILQSIFPKHILIANNRDPYANISSMFYRHTKNIETLKASKREAKLIQLANGWINRSVILKKIINDQNVPYLSYEKFCQNPNLLQDLIDNSKFGGHITLDFKSNVKVKDYEPQGIHDFNSKQIARLTNSDIKVITSSLRDSDELLSFFGYSLRD